MCNFICVLCAFFVGATLAVAPGGTHGCRPTPPARLPSAKIHGGDLPAIPRSIAPRCDRNLIIAQMLRGKDSKGKGSQPLSFGRLKEKGFLRGKGHRNPFPLKCPFGYFSDSGKVPRRRQNHTESTPSETRPRSAARADPTHNARLAARGGTHGCRPTSAPRRVA